MGNLRLVGLDLGLKSQDVFVMKDRTENRRLKGRKLNGEVSTRVQCLISLMNLTESKTKQEVKVDQTDGNLNDFQTKADRDR